MTHESEGITCPRCGGRIGIAAAEKDSPFVREGRDITIKAHYVCPHCSFTGEAIITLDYRPEAIRQ